MRFGAACAGSYVPMPAINENANKQFTSDLFFIRASYQCCLDQRRCFDARNTENLRQNSAPIARSCVNKHHRAIIGMLVSRKFGFLFVHIPKTAGISITRALEPLCEPRTESLLRRLSRHLPIREDVAKVCLPRHATASGCKRNSAKMLLERFTVLPWYAIPWNGCIRITILRAAERNITGTNVCSRRVSPIILTTSHQGHRRGV
jgi:hypothetical protein